MSMRARFALILPAVLCVSGCGSSTGNVSTGASGVTVPGIPALHAHPQAINPTVGQVGQAASGSVPVPVGDPNAHAVSLAEVKRELKIAQELNSLNVGQGFVFPIQPQSIVAP
ncbi:MAG: hypothetical protein M3Z06_12265, partial [Actinomycetota bacterium]|nr:hypothetical protein [Actinomycetota bacterium]